MANLYRITWRYSAHADYVGYETPGYTEWLHERLHHGRPGLWRTDLLSVTAEPISGQNVKGWEWLNPEADYPHATEDTADALTEHGDNWRAAVRRHSVDAGAQGI